MGRVAAVAWGIAGGVVLLAALASILDRAVWPGVALAIPFALLALHAARAEWQGKSPSLWRVAPAMAILGIAGYFRSPMRIPFGLTLLFDFPLGTMVAVGALIPGAAAAFLVRIVDRAIDGISGGSSAGP